MQHRWKEYWAPKYTGKGAVEITIIPNHELVYRVFDYFFQNWMTFDPSAGDYDTSKLRPAEAALWYAWDLDCEVGNGGYNQYFFNKRNRPIEPVVEAYTLLRADQHKELLLLAVKDRELVEEGHHKARLAEQEGVTEMLQSFSETYTDNPLNDLDSRYYKLRPTIEEILTSYIRSHPAEFERR